MKYYAVRIGRNPGIYHTWDECKRETMGFKGASFKKFSTREDAEAFINEIEAVSYTHLTLPTTERV